LCKYKRASINVINANSHVFS